MLITVDSLSTFPSLSGLQRLRQYIAERVGQCTLCAARSAEWICSDCQQDLPHNNISCPSCAMPMTIATTCGRCLKTPPIFAHVVTAFLYAYPLDRLIHQMKFHHQLDILEILGALFIAHSQAHKVPLPNAIIPVPLHPLREMRRGYNQALLLARQCGRQLGVPVISNACQRIRHTPPQTQFRSRERRKNVKGAFKITRRIVPQHVAIIDDVVTTGATSNELARELLAAGVMQVDLWALARATGRQAFL